MNGDYYLANDIDCSGFGNFKPIGTSSTKFTGTFDGKGYKITHLYINRTSTDNVGLFGYTGSGSEIKDVGLEEVSVSGNMNVGGLVGYNRDGTITNSYSSGSVSGSSNYVGGLVGRNVEGTITNSYSSDSVSGSSNYVGGLVGYNSEGTITNSYSIGSVSGSSYVGGLVGYNSAGTITNSYSSGSVSGSSYVGGLVGRNYGTITNSYWDIYRSGQNNCVGSGSSSGCTGKNSGNSEPDYWYYRTHAPMDNWDFDNIWGIVEGITYPYLRWQFACTCGDICVNTTGWWRDGGEFKPSNMPIQHAIEHTTAGDTICVKDGTYNETVDVTKSHLTIRSENGPSVTTVSASLYPDEDVFKISDQTNVTLEGFEIRDAYGTSLDVAGIYMYKASECNISGNIVTNISTTGYNYANGIYLDSSSYNSFHTSTVYNLSSAIYVAYGIYLEDSSDNSFVTSTIYNLSSAQPAYGIYLYYSSDNSFHTSTVYNLDANNGAYGIYLYYSSDNSFHTSTVYNLDANDSSAYGIRLYSSSDNSFHTSTVYNLSADRSAYGIYLYYSSDNSFDTSTVYNLSSANYYAIGIYLYHSSDNSFTSGSISDINAPTWWDFYSVEDAHGNSAEDITISSFPTTISFTYENGIGLKSVATPPADPAAKQNISKYVHVTKVTANSWIFMNVSYEDGDLVGVNENSLRLWKHNGTDWTEVPGTNGVNTAENYVYANITEFSVFAPLGNVTGAKLEINKTGVPDPVSPGGTLNYSISVNNTGNATATNVTVKETYDGNVTFVVAEPAPSPGNDTWQFATLNVSETRWINISVTVNASVPNGTVLHNIVNVTCDEGVMDSDTEDTAVLSALAPVLEINKTGVPDPVSPGSTLNYTISVNNTGNATATNVTVKERYDGNVTFVSAVPASLPGNDTWKFQTLNVSETRWINISVIVNASVLNGTVLHNVVNVTCDEGVMDSDTEDTAVLSAAAPVLEINKTDAPDPVLAGGTLNYSISVNNAGNATATNVTVTETYDGNVTFVTAVPAPSPGNDTWIFATLNASETRWINISVSVNASVLNGTVLHNVVNVTCDEGVSDTDTEDTTVFAVPVCVETATGTGIACFATDSGTIEDLVAVDESTLPEEGKPKLVFPHGFFSFNITGLTPNQSVVVTLTLPDNVPVGTQYWKYHASEGGWIRIPMGSDDGDNILTITLVDGGLGDDDCTANGVIVDQGGPGVRATKPKLTKSAPTSVAPGGTISYTILYANLGPVALTEVTITENYPEGVTFISADPAPDAGTNNMWSIGTLPAGASGQIIIKVKVPDSRDLSFTESGSVTGEGFVMVSKDLSTEQKPYRLKNVVTISCAETDPVTASAFTTVSGVPGTSLEITEHGSGIYESEELLNFGTKNKSIRLQKSTDAEYQPTSFNFSDGFSVVFTNKWMQDICSKNMVLGDAMHKKIKDATYIKDDTKTETGEYGTEMEFASSFHGAAHIGAVSKDVTTSEDYIGEFEIFWAAKEECQYLFNWSRVPGNDSEKLIRFLVDNLAINWAENATITKSDDDRVINISTDWHSAEVILAANNETATVKVGNEIIYVLDVRTEDGTLNVYDCRVRKISESVAGEGYVMVDKELAYGHIQVVEHGSGIYSSDTDFNSQRLNKSTEAEYKPTTFNFSDGFGVNFSSNWMHDICSKDKKAGTAIHKKISDATSIADDTTATKSSMAFETSFNGSIHVGARTKGTRISEDYIGRFNVSQVIKIGDARSTSTSNTSNSSDLPYCP